jgi:AraC-like DNA-binding protein
MVHPLPQDTRGIVDPAAMAQIVDFERYAPGDLLDGIVDWFWSVSWSLPPGTVHDQYVLNHPCGHISIGTVDDSGVPLDPPRGRVYGVLQRRSTRRLMADGWTVAAKTTVGGLGVLLGRSAIDVVGQQLDLLDAVPEIDRSLVATVAASPTNAERVDCLRDALNAVVMGRDETMLAEARRVAFFVRRAEHDRSIQRIEQLAELADVSVRSLQRLFDVHVGVGPSFVLRRFRLIDAAETARHAAGDEDQHWPGWATVATDLGYSDQAHLIRDFKRHLGTTPARYLARQQGVAATASARVAR